MTRIVAFNRETGESRGFAFVNFVNRDDGQRAIDRLDGFGYDNLILRVEWSAPREEKNDKRVPSRANQESEGRREERERESSSSSELARNNKL